MGRISHVADYLTMRRQYRPLQLPRYELDSPNMRLVRREYGWGFSLPLDAVVGEPAIIAFVVNPGTKKRGSTLKRIDYEVQINNRRTPVVAIRLDEVRGVWHVLKGGALRTGEDNTITFRITNDPEPRGVYLDFRDIVLWFQRRVAEAPSVN
jgi:hypothetical protein